MNILRRPSWRLSENEATSESVFLNRRKLMKTAGLGAIGLAAGGLMGCEENGQAQASADEASGGQAPGGQAPGGQADASGFVDPTADLYPARRNPAFTLDRNLTDYEYASTYNNFYEFGSHKGIYKAAQALKTRPWTVVVDGEVAQPKTWDIDALIRAMPLEERLYRLRCVEAWAMAVPWTGFPISALLALAEPTSKAKYVRMETFMDKEVATGQNQFWYPWPYVEALTLPEAMNDLAFFVTGVYGKPLEKQFGAPLRLAVPWKYGFKSIKSIVKITLTEERPVTFWEAIDPKEYGFWANVNPNVAHRRWSQATERLLGTDERVPTQLFNGYEEQVADLYKGLQGAPLYR